MKEFNLLKVIPKNKTIVVAFSGGESSAYALKLILDKYKNTHKIIVCFCNTGEEDEQTFLFTKKISNYFNVQIIWLEYNGKKPKWDKWNAEITGVKGDFKIVDFDSAYRITDWEKENEYPNHPFHKYVKDYGLPQYPERTCTREMKERTISRYLSSIGVMPRTCVRVVGIRFDEIATRTPNPKQYYPLILNGITKPFLNRFFQYEMPFRLEIPSYLGNCAVCISKSIRNLCTIARERPEKFEFFKFLSDTYGEEKHNFYMQHNSITDIFEKSKNESIRSAKDNRFNLNYQQDLFFDADLDSEGACAGTCEAFM
jgi:hypothetical protein